MGLLQLLGLGGRGGERHLVVITFEGPGRLRLNANRTSGKRARQGAIAHEQTIGWIEFSPDGGRLDQGLGPAAGKLGAAELTALLDTSPNYSVREEDRARLFDGPSERNVSLARAWGEQQDPRPKEPIHLAGNLIRDALGVPSELGASEYVWQFA